MTPNIHHAEYAVRKWLETFVVELDLCPFAKPLLRSPSLGIKTISGDVEKCLNAVAEECEKLDTDEKLETSLLILESGFSDFGDYLDLVAMSEALLTDLGYDGIFQIASFHPHYIFTDCSEEDLENYTNRSPFPLIHLLREKSISRALASYDHPERIPERNREVMNRLTNLMLEARLAECCK